MFNRLRVALVAIAFSASVFIASAPTAGAHNTGTGHYYANCTVAPLWSEQAFIDRPEPGNTGIYNLVRSTVNVKTLSPCDFASSGSGGGLSAVNAVNLEYTGGSTYRLLQFGYAMFDCPDLQLQCNGFNDRQVDFWWTGLNCDTCTPIVKAATWVDFNSDGTHDKPEDGQKYTFTIERYVYNTEPFWKYSITAVTGTYAGMTDTRLADRTWSTGNHLFYSFEIYNNASAMGARGSYDIQITPMQYRFSSGGTIYTVTDSDNCEWVDSNNFTTHPTWYECSTLPDGITNYDILKVLTAFHS